MSQIVFNAGGKPKVNVSTIGHIDHGKTTLTAALTKVSFSRYGNVEKISYEKIDSTKEERDRGITINASHVWYVSDHRAYVHVDCPGHADYIKNMIVGSSEIDIAILVVSVIDGVMPQTREHALLVGRIGVPSVVIFVNRVDCFETMDEEAISTIDLVVQEARELLEQYGYKDVPYVAGSARRAYQEDAITDEYGVQSVINLLDQLDRMPIKTRPYEKPFLMQVESVCTVTGRGTVATGRVVRGKVSAGTEVEIVGGAKVIKTTITSIEMFKTQFKEAVAGDDVGVLLRGVERTEIERGNYISVPGHIKTIASFVCEIIVLSHEEGGRSTPFKCGYSPQFYIRSNDVTGVFFAFEEESNTNVTVLPGDQVRAYVRLVKETVLEIGDKFIIREGNITIAAGIVTAILDKPIIDVKNLKKK